MAKTPAVPATIDEYIAAAAPAARPLLVEIRRVVRAAAPEIESEPRSSIDKICQASCLMIRYLLLIALAGPLRAGAQVRPQPSDSALAEITRRGRLLAAYDRAAWHGTDAILAQMPNPVGVEGFVATQEPAGAWHLLFGRLNFAVDTLFIVARAHQASTPDSFRVEIPAGLAVGTAAERAAFRAMQTASADLMAGPRAFDGIYNSYVLPQQDGNWLVYFLPAQQQRGVYLHGGDYRYVVSTDGNEIESKSKCTGRCSTRVCQTRR